MENRCRHSFSAYKKGNPEEQLILGVLLSILNLVYLNLYFKRLIPVVLSSDVESYCRVAC